MIKLEQQSPGSVLKLFIRGYDLTPTSLAKQLKLSQATVRLLTLDKTKISVHIALRLAKFFDMQPDYWLKLQNDYDLAEAANNSKIKAVLQSIPKAEKPTADEKPTTAKKPKAKAAGKKEANPKATVRKGTARAKAADKKEAKPKATTRKGAARGRQPKKQKEDIKPVAKPRLGADPWSDGTGSTNHL